MMYLSKGLRINTSIKNLDLCDNNLGESLVINKSIKQLYLNYSLGHNQKNMMYLTKINYECFIDFNINNII